MYNRQIPTYLPEFMNQYITFFVAHWELSLLFVAAFIWVVVSEIMRRKTSMWNIQPQDAIDLINRKSAVVFDVRDAARYEQGHIVGAKNVLFNPATDDPKTILKITPQTTCVFVCNIGQSSGRAVRALREKGFDNIYNLAGGMAAWQKENLPMVAGK